jgi:hypothetical protein
MELVLIEPRYRCQKCKTPLKFDDWHKNSMEYLDQICEKKRRKEISELPKWLRWTYSPNVFSEGDLRMKMLYDKNVEYWHCPKCFEKYTIKR